MFAALQIGVHHLALDRAGPHDRDFDHEIIEIARPQARQHAHLRARFDLKDAHGLGAADHIEGGRILRRNVLHAQPAAAIALDQVEAAMHSRQHAEREHIDLEQAQ